MGRSWPTPNLFFLSLLFRIFGGSGGSDDVGNSTQQQQQVSSVVINEIADKGTQNACSGEDWIELYNAGTTDVSLAGFMLYDDKGPEDSNAFLFSEEANIPPLDYLLLCCNGDGITNPAFKIGSEDTITLSLIDSSGSSKIDGGSNSSIEEVVEVIDSSGALPDLGVFDRTYARYNSGATAGGRGDFVQTTTPTPGSENVISAAPPSPQSIPNEKNYREQNALGSAFFGMGDDGDTGADLAFDDVVDLHVRVDESEWESVRSHPYAETYVAVEEFRVVSSLLGEHVLASPGRMRPRGQSTLFYPVCMGEAAIPFKLDFASANATQTLFGVETAYLRTHLLDPSKMREWIMHRMLARFGLPHLRTRHVRFHVNGEQIGFYTFMEAFDQEYVMSRNFDYTYKKRNSALYKFKSMGIACGNEDFVSSTSSSFSVESTTEEPEPYSFERGEHRKRVSVRRNADGCWGSFWERNTEERQSVVKAFFDAGFDSTDDCGEFLLGAGLVDRDIGSKDYDAPMEDFINAHISVNGWCENDQCSSKRQIRDKIDVDNWLKNFAVYAVVAEQDSPMGNLNNFFLAAAGDDGTIDSPKWKMVPWDHNNDVGVASVLCGRACGSVFKDLADWSVVRPTCRGLSENPLVGPLLLDPELHRRYLSFVREFVEDVYSDEQLLARIANHARAIASTANSSPDSDTYGAMEASDLFDWMNRRSARVLVQLDLWDNGNLPESASIESTAECATTGLLPRNAIVGISVAAVAAAGIIVGVVVCLYCRRRKATKENGGQVGRI